jgi:hypothetical protein
MLATGFSLSLCGVAGLGSLAALLIGLNALRTINRSPDEISGKWMAWWLIIVGGVGSVVLPIMILSLFVRSNR